MAAWVVVGAASVFTLAVVVVLQSSWLIRRVLTPLFPSVVFWASSCRREIAITIDDGPSPCRGSDEPGSLALLTLLRQLAVPATFFLIGEHTRQDQSGFVAQALTDGHAIGHHMERDEVSALLPADAFNQQFEATQRQLRRHASAHALGLRWFRPGGGWFHGQMLAAVHRHRVQLVLGSVWPWDTFHPPLAFQRWFVLTNAHPGAILVLHDRPDTLRSTLATLRAVVPELQRRGYVFVSLERLLSADRPRSGPAPAA